MYVQCPLVSQVCDNALCTKLSAQFQIFVDGLSSKPYLVAIVVVNHAELKQFLAKQADPNVRELDARESMSYCNQ